LGDWTLTKEGKEKLRISERIIMRTVYSPTSENGVCRIKYNHEVCRLYRSRYSESIMPRPCFTPRERTPVPIGQEAGWAPELVWTQKLEEKSFRQCQRSNPYHLVIQSVVRHYNEIHRLLF
jgi:hypothetical protein